MSLGRGSIEVAYAQGQVLDTVVDECFVIVFEGRDEHDLSGLDVILVLQEVAMEQLHERGD